MTDAELESAVDTWMREDLSLCACKDCRSEYIDLARRVRVGTARAAVDECSRVAEDPETTPYTCASAIRARFGVEP